MIIRIVRKNMDEKTSSTGIDGLDLSFLLEQVAPQLENVLDRKNKEKKLKQFPDIKTFMNASLSSIFNDNHIHFEESVDENAEAFLERAFSRLERKRKLRNTEETTTSTTEEKIDIPRVFIDFGGTLDPQKRSKVARPTRQQFVDRLREVLYLRFRSEHDDEALDELALSTEECILKSCSQRTDYSSRCRAVIARARKMERFTDLKVKKPDPAIETKKFLEKDTRTKIIRGKAEQPLAPSADDLSEYSKKIAEERKTLGAAYIRAKKKVVYIVKSELKESFKFGKISKQLFEKIVEKVMRKVMDSCKFQWDKVSSSAVDEWIRNQNSKIKQLTVAYVDTYRHHG